MFLFGALFASVLHHLILWFHMEKNVCMGCDPLIFLGAEWCLQVTVTLLAASPHMGFVQGDIPLKSLSNLTPLYNIFSVMCHYLCIDFFTHGSPKLSRASAHSVLSWHEANLRSEPKGLWSYRLRDDCRPGADPKALSPRLWPFTQGILPWLPTGPCRA